MSDMYYYRFLKTIMSLQYALVTFFQCYQFYCLFVILPNTPKSHDKTVTWHSINYFNWQKAPHRYTQPRKTMHSHCTHSAWETQCDGGSVHFANSAQPNYYTECVKCACCGEYIFCFIYIFAFELKKNSAIQEPNTHTYTTQPTMSRHKLYFVYVFPSA